MLGSDNILGTDSGNIIRYTDGGKPRNTLGAVDRNTIGLVENNYMGSPTGSFNGSKLLDKKEFGWFFVTNLTHLPHSEQSCSLLYISTP